MDELTLRNEHASCPGHGGRAGGFSLVELIVAMVIAMVILGAMYNVFTIQNKTFNNQEEIVAMQQNVRASVDMMAREIGMAGYDPARVNSDASSTNNFTGVTVDSTQLQIRADLDGSGAIDALEANIIYAFDSGSREITRNRGAGNRIFMENVEAFTFQYLDGSGAVTANAANVRSIRITITGRTAKPDPDYAANGGYRTYALTSVVNVRNLGI